MEESYLKMRISLLIIFLVFYISTTGCLIDTYESCVRKQYPILGFQSPPLLTTRETAELILSNQIVSFTFVETNLDVLETISKETTVPIILKGDVRFLYRKITAEPYSGKSALNILKLLAENEKLKYSVEEGWVKLE